MEENSLQEGSRSMDWEQVQVLPGSLNIDPLTPPDSLKMDQDHMSSTESESCSSTSRDCFKNTSYETLEEDVKMMEMFEYVTANLVKYVVLRPTSTFEPDDSTTSSIQHQDMPLILEDSQEEVLPNANDSQEEVLPNANDSQEEVLPNANDSQEEVLPNANDSQEEVLPNANDSENELSQIESIDDAADVEQRPLDEEHEDSNSKATPPSAEDLAVILALQPRALRKRKLDTAAKQPTEVKKPLVSGKGRGRLPKDDNPPSPDSLKIDTYLKGVDWNVAKINQQRRYEIKRHLLTIFEAKNNCSLEQLDAMRTEEIESAMKATFPLRFYFFYKKQPGFDKIVELFPTLKYPELDYIWKDLKRIYPKRLQGPQMKTEVERFLLEQLESLEGSAVSTRIAIEALAALCNAKKTDMPDEELQKLKLNVATIVYVMEQTGGEACNSVFFFNDEIPQSQPCVRLTSATSLWSIKATFDIYTEHNLVGHCKGFSNAYLAVYMYYWLFYLEYSRIDRMIFDQVDELTEPPKDSRGN